MVKTNLALTTTMPRIAEQSVRSLPLDTVAGKRAKTILVVEDNEMVRQLIVEILLLSEYLVIQASNGSEAFETCRNHSGPVDLLLTDVVMPQMGGRELAGQMARLRPDTKVLYMSGYSDEMMTERGLLRDRGPFIEKPFAPAALLVKVLKTLEETPIQSVTVSQELVHLTLSE